MAREFKKGDEDIFRIQNKNSVIKNMNFSKYETVSAIILLSNIIRNFSNTCGVSCFQCNDGVL
jgi:hypothetical protein